MRALGTTFVLVLLLAACGGDTGGDSSPDGTSDGPPTVYTTFYPTTYLAERLAGDDAKVVCPLPDDEDPIFWKPPEEVILAYQQADLIVVNGAEFEKWVPLASLPESKVVSTAEPFREGWLTYEQAVEHTHGPSGKHAHEGIDGHTWVDPVLAKAQSDQILAGLFRVLPDGEARQRVQARLDALHADLDALDARFREVTKDYDGHAIYASHPAYNYIAKRYDWKVVSLDLDPEEMPSAEVFAEIKAQLAATPARHILWEGNPLPEIAARFRDELGLESIWFSPCEGPPEGGVDYLARMNRNVDELAPALAPWTD